MLNRYPIAFRLIFCLGLILIAALASRAQSPRWILHYTCDSQASVMLCSGSSERTKEFGSRAEAIAFTESSYWVVPLRLNHGKRELVCWWEYLDGDRSGYETDDDAPKTLAKAVDCDSEETLTAAYCDEDSGCSAHMTHHEH